MKDMILFPEDIDRLNVILEQLALKANLLLAILINKDGRLLTYQGSLENVDTVSMAALVAGNSASTLAIANLMGETEFSSMYHQGKDRHIFISVIDENTFLCLVFDERTNIDRVKVFARQFDRQLKNALKQVYEKTEDQVDLDLDLGAADQQSFSYKDFSKEQEGHYQQPPKPIRPNLEGSKQDRQKVLGGEDDIFFIDNRSKEGNPLSGESHDTNYLFLKKKIKETVNRKKEQ